MPYDARRPRAEKITEFPICVFKLTMTTGRQLSNSPRHWKAVMPSYTTTTAAWFWLAIGFFVGHYHGSSYSTIINERKTMSYAVGNSTHWKPPNDGGWRRIDVFYGQSDPLDDLFPSNSTNHPWFSQAAQDELIIGLLRGKRDGYFIDLAANDATLLSNTYALERFYGWNGLCVEPNPSYWKNLTYRKCQTVGAVIGNTRDEPVWFRFEAGDHGGIAGDGFNNGKRWQRHSHREYTVPLLEVLQRYNVPTVIDYLSLDVEGAEAFIMKQFPLHQYRINIITAERLKGEIRSHLKDNGFEFICKLTRWGESLWVHRSVKDQLDWSVIQRFRFPMG